MPSSEIRKEVMAHIIDFMTEAEQAGRDPYKAAKEAFPGTPDLVLTEAWMELDDRHVEAWWQSIEKTIDGEIITKALASS